jgi:hypothetical protein
MLNFFHSRFSSVNCSNALHAKETLNDGFILYVSVGACVSVRMHVCVCVCVCVCVNKHIGSSAYELRKILNGKNLTQRLLT